MEEKGNWNIVINPEYVRFKDFIITTINDFESSGEVIYSGRNELRKVCYKDKEFVFKSFHKPNFINKFIYGTIRKSKAKRSYYNSLCLNDMGIGTPSPVAYIECVKGMTFSESYYISLASSCRYVYKDLFERDFACAKAVCKEIGYTTAILHENGIAHKDYSRGNILFDYKEDKVTIELVDLNRMYHGKIGIYKGCKNFNRLPATPQMHRWMAESYAHERCFDADRCFRLMRKYRSNQPGKIDGIY